MTNKKRKMRIKSHHLEKSAIFIMLVLGIIAVIVLFNSLSLSNIPLSTQDLQLSVKALHDRQNAIVLLELVLLIANFVQFIVLARIYEQHEE